MPRIDWCTLRSVAGLTERVVRVVEAVHRTTFFTCTSLSVTIVSLLSCSLLPIHNLSSPYLSLTLLNLTQHRFVFDYTSMQFIFDYCLSRFFHALDSSFFF